LYFTSGLFFLKIDSKRVYWIFLFSFFVLGGSMLYDMIYSSSMGIRGSGFAENPNNAALRIVFLLIAILRFIESKRIAFIFCFVAFLFVFLTLSRSGVLVILAIVLILLPAKFSDVYKISEVPLKIFKSMPVLFILLVVLANTLTILPEYFPAFEHRAAVDRIQQISGKGSIVNESDLDGGRINIFSDYLDLFLENVLGYGTGFSMNRDFFEKATHNMFLRFGIDYGVVGVLALLAFFYRFLRISIRTNHFYMFSLMLAAFMACFFTHTLFENRTFILVLSFLSVDVVRSNIAYKS
jgi:hypothetical protein